MYKTITFLRRFSQYFFLALLFISPIIQFIRTFRQDPYPYLESPLATSNWVVQRLLIYDQKIMAFCGELFTQISGGSYSLRFYDFHFSEPFTSLIFTLKNMFHLDYWSYTMAFSLFAPILIAIIAARFYCGYICPMSIVVNLNLKLRKLLKIKSPLVKKLDDSPIYFGILVLVFFSNPLLLQFVLPSAMLQHAISDFILFGGFSFWLLAFIILLAYEIINPTSFCKNLCPTGHFLSFLGKFRRIFVTYKDKSPCDKGCDLCNENCWLGLKPKSIAKDPSCDLCMRCVSICPPKRLVGKILLLSLLIIPNNYTNIWDQERDFSEVEYEIALVENKISLGKTKDSDNLYFSLTGTYLSGRRPARASLLIHRSSKKGVYKKKIKIEIYHNKKLIKSEVIKTVNAPESVRVSSAYKVDFTLIPYVKYTVYVSFLEENKKVSFKMQYPTKRF